jgi:hypothetical protein
MISAAHGPIDGLFVPVLVFLYAANCEEASRTFREGFKSRIA